MESRTEKNGVEKIKTFGKRVFLQAGITEEWNAYWKRKLGLGLGIGLWIFTAEYWIEKDAIFGLELSCLGFLFSLLIAGYWIWRKKKQRQNQLELEWAQALQDLTLQLSLGFSLEESLTWLK